MEIEKWRGAIEAGRVEWQEVSDECGALKIEPQETVEMFGMIWREVLVSMEEAVEAFKKWITAVAAQIEAKHELETALRWASCYYRTAFNRYRHTKKKRTRKKYEKKILAWYREEVLGKW